MPDGRPAWEQDHRAPHVPESRSLCPKNPAPGRDHSWGLNAARSHQQCGLCGQLGAPIDVPAWRYEEPIPLPAKYAAVKIPARFGNVETRYLTLMAHAVTRLGLEPMGETITEARYYGTDWPATAETMVGIPRLENFIGCVTDALDRDVPGDICEAGVWRGGAAIMAAAVLEALHNPVRRRKPTTTEAKTVPTTSHRARKVWVADSFAGLPVPDSDRYPVDQGDTHHENLELAVPQAEVEANFERYGLAHRAVFLPGWFTDSLPGPIGPLCVLRIDVDMYGSTMEALEALYPLLSVGGWLILDDVLATGGGHRGCDPAVADWRAAHDVAEPMLAVPGGLGAYWRKETE